MDIVMQMKQIAKKSFITILRNLQMIKQISLSVILTIFLSATCFASEILDTYYPKFETCLHKLDKKFEMGTETYKVVLNYKSLLNYMEKMDTRSIKVIASIAIEWDQDTEFPAFESLFNKEGKLQLAKAIQTAQARAILKAAESILFKNITWL